MMGSKRRRYRTSRASPIRALPNTSIADSIKRQIAIYFKKKMRAVYFEIGLLKGGQLRADVLVLAMNGHLVILEV